MDKIMYAAIAALVAGSGGFAVYLKTVAKEPKGRGLDKLAGDIKTAGKMVRDG